MRNPSLSGKWDSTGLGGPSRGRRIKENRAPSGVEDAREIDLRPRGSAAISCTPGSARRDAGRGFGRLMALALCADGANVLGTAGRHRDELESTAREIAAQGCMTEPNAAPHVM